MKKILSSILTILLLLTNCKIVFAADDTTPPSIDNVIISEEEVKIGDTIKIEIEASDSESGFSENIYCSLWLQNELGGKLISNLTPKYNVSTKKFEVTFTITKEFTNGRWYVRHISLYDNAGNYNDKWWYDANTYSFKVIDGIEDAIPPSIDNVIISKEEVKIGDTIKIEIEASDSESGFSENVYCSLWLQNELGGKLISNLTPKYNVSTKKFEVTFTITKEFTNGRWYVRHIGLYDNAGNYNDKWWYDANTYSFKVIDGIEDAMPPSIDNVIISKEEVKIGDTIKIEIEASDSESGFSENVYCSLWLQNELGGKLISNLSPKYNVSTKKFEVTFTITKEFTNGRWYVRHIGLYDNAGNYNDKWWYDANTYSFKVLSSFLGTENKSVKKGENFNPLDDISAINNLDGDFTDKITYTGNVDTNKEGIYLIKYQAIGNSGYIYNDYRWITVVNNVITDENGNEEVYFNKDVVLNLNGEISSSSMTITKDGQEYVISESGTITEEGVYKVSLNETSQNTQTYSENELNNEIKEQEEYIRSEYNSKSNSNEGSYNLEFIVDKTAPEISEIKTNIGIEGEVVDASEFILANDKYNSVFYSYINEPNWTKVGKQNINIQVSDAAGNTTNKELEITIYDKCDIDNSGVVDIFDLAETSLNYNKNKDSSDWNKRLDFNKDGIIDIFDLVALSKKL